MKTVEHDGRETAYRIGRPAEDGPTALYVHGSGGTHRVWAHQYGPDGPTHPAVALDLSGHGDSDDVGVDAGEETLAAYASDVCAVARAVDADVLVGNSLGGAVVLYVLLERSLSVDGAILAGCGAKLAVTEQLREWLAEDFERAVEWLHGSDRLFHDADEQTVDRSKQTMRAVGRAVTERDFLTAHTFDVRHRLGEIRAPVLAAGGEYDKLTPQRFHEFLAEEIPSGRMGTLEDAAHLAMLERPEAFNRAVGTFVESIEPRHS